MDVFKQMDQSQARVLEGGATQDDWNFFALCSAQKEYTENFASRRGTVIITGCYLPLIVMYDNNPYQIHPTKRDEEIAETVDRLEALGIKKLGMGSYPTAGESKGYTLAVVLQAEEEQEAKIGEVWHEVLNKSDLMYFPSGK